MGRIADVAMVVIFDRKSREWHPRRRLTDSEETEGYLYHSKSDVLHH